MKVLFQSRVDLYGPRGGDTIQMEQTKAAIEKLDPSIHIDIDVSIHNKNILDYDIVHLFNLDWIPETYLQARWAKKHGKKVVLSAIHHSEKEVLLFEKKARFGIRRIYNAIIPWQSMRDTWKNIYRSVFDYRKIYPTLIQLLKGIRNEQREIVRMSDIVLVQTEREALDIKKDFGINNFRWEKVVNGVNTKIFNKKSKKKIKKNYILNVGRIEPRKNQLNLIKAFNDLIGKGKLPSDYRLIFVGAKSTKHPEYVYRFIKAVGSSKNIEYLGYQTMHKLSKLMSEASIYVHPSWFETTGLVCLEAAMSGTKIVATGDRTKEYVGKYASYCKPDDINSIKKAIMMSYNSSFDIEKLQNDIIKMYSWEQTAKQTISVYRKLVDN